MEWRGGDHIIPDYLREDNLPEDRCDRCDAPREVLTWDGLCDECFVALMQAAKE